MGSNRQWWQLLDPARRALVDRRPAIILDAELRVVCLASAFCEEFGYTESEHLGVSPPFAWHPPEDREMLTQAVRQLDSPIARLLPPETSVPLYLQRANGERVLTAASHEVVADEAGRTAFHALYSEPVDEDRAPSAEERLGRVARDIRDALTQLRELGLVEALKMDPTVQVDPPLCGMLSNREGEVFQHLLNGARQDDIARALYISPHTTRNHMKSIFKKLGIHSQLELIRKFRLRPGAHG